MGLRATSRRVLAHLLAAAWVSWWLAGVGASEVYDAQYCEEPGRVLYVRPVEPLICTRTGNLNGVHLREECKDALRNIADGPGAGAAVPGVKHMPQADPTKKMFCQPGRVTHQIKSVFTCTCTVNATRKRFDCHRGETPDKPMPDAPPASGRALKMLRKCTADLVVYKMYTDYCNTFGTYVTYDDCISPRNHTMTVEGMQQRDNPVICLPGSYVIYMRCQLCRCVAGVFKDCDVVDCPWNSPGMQRGA